MRWIGYLFPVVALVFMTINYVSEKATLFEYSVVVMLILIFFKLELIEHGTKERN